MAHDAGLSVVGPFETLARVGYFFADSMGANVSVSSERLDAIRELSTFARIDGIDFLSLSEAEQERFCDQLDADRTAFCRDTSDPEELHAFAVTWEWQDNDDECVHYLQKIVENPACEAATALLIYWRCAPEFYRQFSDRSGVIAAKADVDCFDLVSEIETKYVAGEFPAGRSSFDPNRPEDCGGYSYAGAYDDMKHKFVRALPAVMYAPVIGRPE